MKLLKLLLYGIIQHFISCMVMTVTNVNMDYLYPEFWAAGFDSLDMGEYNLQNFVNRDVEPLIASMGDTINVPITPDFGDAAAWVPGATITPSNTTQTLAQVILNQSKQQARGFNDKELSMSKYNLIESYAAPMAKSILAAVNKSLYSELLKTPYFVDATAGLSEDFVADAGTMLSKNEVGKQNRRLVGSPDMIGVLRKVDAFQSMAINNTDAIIKDGLIRRQYGFDIYENNVISKYTPADVTGAINNSGGYNIGDTVLVVKNFADSALPVKIGDVLKFTGMTGTPWYTVTATNVSTNTIGITVTPSLTEAVADSCVITITPTQSLLAFVPSALAFAARAYATASKPGVNSAIVDVQGLPVRISTWTDSATLNLNVAYDILYGQTMVNPKRCVRILEDA